MLRRYNEVFLGLLKLADMLTVVASFGLAYLLRFETDWFPAPIDAPDVADHQLLALGAAVIFHFLILSRGLYQSRRRASSWEEAQKMGQVALMGTILLAAGTFFVRPLLISRLVLALFVPIVGSALIAERVLIRATLKSLRRRGYNKRSVLIVGTGELAHALLQRFRDHAELGFEVVGCVGKRVRPSRLKILGGYNDLNAVVGHQNPDLIFVALDRVEYEDPIKLVQALGNTAASIRIVPDLIGIPTELCTSEDFDGLPLICLVDRPVYGWASLTKRLVDLVGAAGLFVLLSPVMLAAALAIRLTSRTGGVLYRQTRVSLDGRKFQMYKFRSMIPNAEADTGPVRARPDDPRCTPVGSFLRRTSIDELPQLWNVIKGDMSLVGPRPERPELIERFRMRIPGYMLRHKVKGGVTGLAQINGARGHTPIEERLRYDMEYASRWSLWVDAKILLLTVVRVFRDPNAY